MNSWQLAASDTLALIVTETPAVAVRGAIWLTVGGGAAEPPNEGATVTNTAVLGPELKLFALSRQKTKTVWTPACAKA